MPKTIKKSSQPAFAQTHQLSRSKNKTGRSGLEPEKNQRTFNSGFAFGDIVFRHDYGRGMVYSIVLQPLPGLLVAYQAECVLELSPAHLTRIGSIFDL